MNHSANISGYQRLNGPFAPLLLGIFAFRPGNFNILKSQCQIDIFSRFSTVPAANNHSINYYGRQNR